MFSENLVKIWRHVTMRGKVHIQVSKFSVKNQSDGRYIIGDIYMFRHVILKHTLQERKTSAWWILHIMKQNKKIERLRPISDNFQTLLKMMKRNLLYETVKTIGNKKNENKTWRIGQLVVRFRYYLVHLMT